MAKKSTEIVVQFKDLPINLFRDKGDEIDPNLLVIRIQPDEGITLHLNAKKTDYDMSSTPIEIRYNKSEEDVESPEAYEALLNDCLNGDSTRFVHSDEVALSWRFIDTISSVWEKEKADFPNYASGTDGPKEADELLAKDGFHWWEVK